MERPDGKRGIFDPISGQLENFYNDNATSILENRREERERLWEPIKPFIGKALSGTRAFNLLQEVFVLAENRFTELCSAIGLDDMMAIMRRAPAYAMGGTNWLAYMALGLVKHSNPSRNTIAGTFKVGSTHAMVHMWSVDSLLNADRLGSLAGAMDEIAGVMRWIGKGAEWQPTTEDPLNCRPSPEVAEAVFSYENRRPGDLFRDQGLLTGDSSDRKEMILVLAASKVPLWLYVPGRDMSLNVNFVPEPIPWRPIWRVLESYREAIEDLFKIHLEALPVFIEGLSTNIWHTLLWPQSGDEKDFGLLLNLLPDDGTEAYEHRLGFTFRLLRTGYLRFSREHWVNAFARVQVPSVPTEQDRRKLTEEFFDAFAVTPTARQRIDLSVLRPYPFTFQAPSGEFYVDLRGLGDFLRDLVEKAKEWFSSQHGDRFTLSLKTMIERELGGGVILGKKLKVRNSAGGRTECDLLVSMGSILYVVECKAHAKSPELFRGDPEAVQRRISLLGKDYKQAEEAALAVSYELNQADSALPPHRYVEFCVCTPAQEFIRPVGRFGYLAEGAPRICTPEELIKVLRSKDVRN